ncbi:hypothetical protein FGB62_42g36 [Gracilaria domingensis]|nr:hypothetical protein FGB62_42g36 [Gracilaria domingensis]
MITDADSFNQRVGCLHPVPAKSKRAPRMSTVVEKREHPVGAPILKGKEQCGPRPVTEVDGEGQCCLLKLPFQFGDHVDYFSLLSDWPTPFRAAGRIAANPQMTKVYDTQHERTVDDDVRPALASEVAFLTPKLTEQANDITIPAGMYPLSHQLS